MQMPKFITKWRRERAVEAVCRVGRERADLLRQRREIDGTFEHTAVDAAYLDSRIESLDKRREKLIEFIKTTPAY